MADPNPPRLHLADMPNNTLKLGIVVGFLPLAIGFTFFAPQGLTWLFMVQVAVMLVVFWSRLSVADIVWGLGPMTVFLVFLGLFLTWAVICSLWSADKGTALHAVTWFSVSALAAVIGCLAARYIGAEGRWHWFYFPIVTCLAALILIVVMTHVLKLSPIGGKRLEQEWHYNRAALLIVMLLPVALFAVERMRVETAWKLIISTVTCLIVTLSIFMSQSESAKLALIVVALAQTMLLLSIRWTARLVACVLIGLLVALPFLLDDAIAMFGVIGIGSHQPETYMARLQIWLGMLPYIERAPWFGNGVEFVRGAGHVVAATGERVFHNHPHSFILQTWVDLGLVGVLLLGGVLASLIKLIAQLPQQPARMYLSMLLGVLAIWSVSHGMWQSWFVGLSSGTAIFAALCDHRARAEAGTGCEIEICRT